MFLSRSWAVPGYCLGGKSARYLLRIVGFLFALLSVNSASAAVPLVDSYCVNYSDHCSSLGYFPSQGAACSATAATFETEYRKYGVDTSAGTCKVYRIDRPDDFYNFSFNYKSSCPANSVLSGSSCVCDPGFDEQGGQCKHTSSGNSCNGLSDFCSGLKGEKINLEGKGTATPPGCSADSQRPNCPMGCAGEAVGMGVSYKTPDGSWMTGQEYRVTGGTCTLPQPSDVPQKKESDCAGSVGEINGVRTCVPNQAATGDTTSKETKNGDGTSSNTESKTTCEKGVCTTTSTTTTKDASGNTTSTSTSSSSSSQREYCAANKASTVCAATNGDKNPDGKDGSGKDGEECTGDDCKETPSKFTGSCEAGFSCDGDALQCAIAQDQHRRTCQLFDTQSAESRLYDSEKGKTGSQTKDLPGNETIDFGSNRIDTSSALGGGTCLTDLQISVMGHSETLPLSQYCKWLDYAGNILVAVALLGALRIITRS